MLEQYNDKTKSWICSSASAFIALQDKLMTASEILLDNLISALSENLTLA